MEVFSLGNFQRKQICSFLDSDGKDCTYPAYLKCFGLVPSKCSVYLLTKPAMVDSNQIRSSNESLKRSLSNRQFHVSGSELHQMFIKYCKLEHNESQKTSVTSCYSLQSCKENEEMENDLIKDDQEYYPLNTFHVRQIEINEKKYLDYDINEDNEVVYTAMKQRGKKWYWMGQMIYMVWKEIFLFLVWYHHTMVAFSTTGTVMVNR